MGGVDNACFHRYSAIPPLQVAGEQPALANNSYNNSSNNSMTQNGVMMKGPLGEVFKVPEDNRKELESLNKSLMVGSRTSKNVWSGPYPTYSSLRPISPIF